jgi:hypothetical protein
MAARDLRLFIKSVLVFLDGLLSLLLLSSGLLLSWGFWLIKRVGSLFGGSFTGNFLVQNRVQFFKLVNGVRTKRPKLSEPEASLSLQVFLYLEGMAGGLASECKLDSLRGCKALFEHVFIIFNRGL